MIIDPHKKKSPIKKKYKVQFLTNPKLKDKIKKKYKKATQINQS
jgi:hypothetical protein